MKYLLLIAMVSLFGYVGYGLSSYYTNRVKFYKNLGNLFEKLSLQINFSNQKIIEILSNFSSLNKDIKTLIFNYINCLEYNLEINEKKLFENIKLLNEDEKNTICLYFLSLGKLDSINQVSELHNQISQIKTLTNDVEQQAKKYAPLYIKLGIILGLTLALLLL